MKYEDWLRSIQILTVLWNQIDTLFNTNTKKVTVAKLLSLGYEFDLLCHYLLKPFIETA